MSSDNENEAGSDVEEPKTKAGAKRKGKKEKKGPKRPLSAYMYFCKAKRAAVKEENPTLDFSALGKKLGQLWQELDEASKKPYIKQNELAKKKYEEEKANMPAGEDDDDEEGAGKKKKQKTGKAKKDKDAPKNAKSAYMFFCADERKRLREEEGVTDFKEIGKKMGENWRQLGDDEKAKYIKLNEEAKAEAAAAKAAYAKANPGKVAAKKGKGKKAKAAAADDDEPAADDDDDDADEN